MMTPSMKVALLCGMVLSSGLAVRAQDVFLEEGALTAPQFDAAVNGATDRFGMPLPSSFVGPPLIRSNPVSNLETGRPAVEAPNRATRSRTKSSTRRSMAKTKNAQRTSDVAKPTSRPVPRYFLPHGSLEWSRTPGSINTSPADPYGYGYGFSGYGTEVFGDFWKGWPIVQY